MAGSLFVVSSKKNRAVIPLLPTVVMQHRHALMASKLDDIVHKHETIVSTFCPYKPILVVVHIKIVCS